MCGIMGYVGPQEAGPILLDGLRRLEYRGYDSAGIAVHQRSRSMSERPRARSEPRGTPRTDPLAGSIGIGHTRWATHGAAHRRQRPSPHRSVRRVRRGAQRHHRELPEPQGRAGAGAEFSSKRTARSSPISLPRVRWRPGRSGAQDRRAIRGRLRHGRDVDAGAPQDRCGAQDQPAGRRAGRGRDLPRLRHPCRASSHPGLPHRRGRRACRGDRGRRCRSRRSQANRSTATCSTSTWDAEQAEKGGYDHFMLKEIHEQPAVVTETLAGRLDEDGSVWLEDVGFDDDYAARSTGSGSPPAVRHSTPGSSARRSSAAPEAPDQRRVRPRAAIRRSHRWAKRADDRHLAVG